MTIPTCPTCGGCPAGHSAEACLEIVTVQLDCVVDELVWALWRLMLAERRERAWKQVAVLAMKIEKKEGVQI